MADIPTSRGSFACSAVGNKIYCIAGTTYIDGASNNADVNECYDTITDTWTTLTQSPTAGGGIGSCAVDGYIYVFYSSVTHRYDPKTDTWSNRTSKPYARYSGSVTVVGTKIYYIGGWNSVSPHASTLCYDTVTDTWQMLTPMSIGRGYLTGEAIGNYIYIIGGYKRVDGVSVTLSLNERYDTLTDTWETQKDMPSVRGYIVSGVVNNEIYVLGGTIRTRNERFSPFNNPDFSFEITHENEILFDQAVLIDSDFISPNTRTKVDAGDGMTLLFPETTSGTIALTGNIKTTLS